MVAFHKKYTMYMVPGDLFLFANWVCVDKMTHTVSGDMSKYFSSILMNVVRVCTWILIDSTCI